jgi:hypothetical protein
MALIGWIDITLCNQAQKSLSVRLSEIFERPG